MNPKALALPREYWLPVLGFVLSAILVFVHLYQMEIITIWIAQGKFTFEFPWFLGGSVNIWWARDVWYAVNVIGWSLGVNSGYYLGSIAVSRNFVKIFKAHGIELEITQQPLFKVILDEIRKGNKT